MGPWKLFSILRSALNTLRWPAVFAFAFFVAGTTQGEYRAFLLEIKSPGAESVRLVPSSLDPLQYRYYYPLMPGETVSYTQTWLCAGRTSSLPVCANPREGVVDSAGAKPDEAPSSKSLERKPAGQ